jgi:hypothetical protein
MEETHTLLYMHRNKLNIEPVGIWQSTRRATTLRGCCATTIYRITSDNQLHAYIDNIWTSRLPKDVPEEIKLAAMIVN